MSSDESDNGKYLRPKPNPNLAQIYPQFIPNPTQN